MTADVQSYLEKADSLRQAGRSYDEILCYLDALALDPTLLEAYYRLGRALLKINRYPQAVETFQQLLQLSPQHSRAHLYLAHALAQLGKPEEAMVHYEQAYQLTGIEGILLRKALTVPVIYPSESAIQAWRQRIHQQIEALLERQSVIDDPLVDVGTPPFYLAYQGCDDLALQRKLSKLFQDNTPLPARTTVSGQKPRIGFISRYFSKSHSVGKFMKGIMKHLCRDRFEVVVFSVGPEKEATRQDFCPCPEQDRFISLPTNNLAAARQAILDAEVDILFYPDIGMEPVTYFLAHSRLAPIQCTTWGHPVTTGIETMDYFISCKLAEPEGADAHYCEKLVLLDTPPTYFHQPAIQPSARSKTDFDLAPTDHVYICPQSLFKLNPTFDTLIGGILRRDPHGKLILFSGDQPTWNDQLMARFETSIPDVTTRIEIRKTLPLQDYIDFMAISDAMLDTTGFGGGNTSLEAFYVGVPIVTLPGQYLRGRITSCWYRKMGVLDCIAETPEQYIEIAVRLGTDPTYRSQIRHKILASNAVLYEDLQAVRELEAFFIQALEAKI